MYRIVRKEALKPTVVLFEIEAPMIARKAQPGHCTQLNEKKYEKNVEIYHCFQPATDVFRL